MRGVMRRKNDRDKKKRTLESASGCVSQSLLSKVIAVTKAKTESGYEKPKDVFTN